MDTVQSLKPLVTRGLRALGMEDAGRLFWKRARNFGLKNECPMCRSHLSAMIPGGEDHPVLTEKQIIGGGPRPNVVCPVCGSRDRERLLYLFLNDRPELLAEGTRLLHVAPERNLGIWLRSLPQVRYESADLMMEGVNHRFDLTDIPMPAATYDAIICSHVLEHIPDDRKAMAELHRILKPGGWAILQVPISRRLDATYEDFSITAPDEREHAFGQYDHVRIYAFDYADRLAEAGFDVEQFRWTDQPENYGGHENRYALIPEEVVFFVRRSPRSATPVRPASGTS